MTGTDLTNGKIGKSLIIFSLPMIFGNLLQQLYNVADTLIVGRTMGAAALAAVGSSYALMVLLTSVIIGLCMGSGVLFSQLFGAKNTDDMKTGIFNAFVFVLIISVVINILSYILLDSFILWLNIPPESALYTRQYLEVIFSGIIFIFIYNFFTCVLRSIGNTVVPLIFLAVSAVVNIVLDIVFIVCFHMGVSGAALATVIAQGLSAACMVFYFFVKAKHLCPARVNMRYDKRLLRLIIQNSTLTAVQQSIMNFGILMVQGLVNSFGFAASAAFAVVVKIDAFAYMPAQDFGNAFATFVAQNYGAGRGDRIKKGSGVAFMLSSVFCAAASVFIWIFSKPLMLMFMDEAEVASIAVGVEYLHIVGSFYIGIGILFLLYGLYRGLSKAGTSVVLTVISLGLRVGLAYMLSALPQIGLVGIWWAIPIGWVIADAFGLIYFYKKRLFSAASPLS